MTPNRRVLDALIDASRRKDHDAFLALLTDDIEYYWSMSRKPAVGKEKLRKFLRNYEAAYDQQAWHVQHCVEDGDVMLVEGVEKILDRARGVVVDNPFMQAYEFRDGRIARLRDYYDPTLLSPPAAPAAAPKTPLLDTLKRLQAAIEARDKAAFLSFFADDVVYHYHVGSRPLVGKAWVDRFITKYWANHSATHWRILHASEVGDRLLTEGVEEYVNARGDTVHHPYMGIIEFRDGLIVGWRDYFQMADPAAAPVGVPVSDRKPGEGK
jgi:ketosteroid isomerase-like protein